MLPLVPPPYPGPIFPNSEARGKYASYIFEGTGSLVRDSLSSALDAMQRGDQVRGG